MTDCIIGNAVAAIERTQAATPGRGVIHDGIANDVGIAPVDKETAATCDRCVLHNRVGLNYALLISTYINTSTVKAELSLTVLSVMTGVPPSV